MITFDDFLRLSIDAMDRDDFDSFLAEEGGSVDCEDIDVLIRDLRYIYTARTVSDIRAATGLSRAEFSRKFGIPVRSLEDWEAGRRVPPDYVVKLLAYAALPH